MRPLAVAVAVLVASICGLGRADAAPRPSRPLPFDAWRDVDVVPWSPPTVERPRGTVMVVGTFSSPRTGDLPHARLLEWDLDAERIVGSSDLGATARALRAARTPTGAVLVTGGWLDDEGVTLFTIDRAMRAVAREPLGIGTNPSLAVDGSRVVTGFYEPHVPVVPPDSEMLAPSHAFHVLVLDVGTHAILGARVFRGGTLLRPHAMSSRSEHAIALVGDEVVVTLPATATSYVVAAKLPSLAATHERVLQRPQDRWASVPLYPLGKTILALDDVPIELGPSLEVVARRPDASDAMAVAYDAKAGRVGTVRIADDVEPGGLVFAWGALVCVGHDEHGAAVIAY